MNSARVVTSQASPATCWQSTWRSKGLFFRCRSWHHLLHEGLVEDRREVIFGLVRHPSLIEVHRCWGLLRSMSPDPRKQHRRQQRHHAMASRHGSLPTSDTPSPYVFTENVSKRHSKTAHCRYRLFRHREVKRVASRPPDPVHTWWPPLSLALYISPVTATSAKSFSVLPLPEFPATLI